MEFKVKSPVLAKSKKAFAEAVKAGDAVIVVNVSDVFEPSFAGAVQSAPNGRHIAVGPDPYTNRKWFARVDIRDGVVKVK